MSDKIVLKVSVDTEKMTLRDLVTLDKSQTGAVSMEELLTTLDNFVDVDGYESVFDLPVAHLDDLIAAISDAVSVGKDEQEKKD